MLNNARFYVLRNGKVRPAKDFDEAADCFADMNRRRVDYTWISPEVAVSTVFTVLDYREYQDEPPVLFETMILGGAYNGNRWQYHTYGQAHRGHWEIVDALRLGKEDPCPLTGRHVIVPIDDSDECEGQ